MMEIEKETDELQAMINVGDPQPALPDLVITSITSNLPVTNGPCPGNNPIANATCSSPGGQVNVTLTAVVRNRTSIAINNPFVVEFCLAGGGCTSRTISGLAGNTSVTVNSAMGALACPVGPPPYGLVTRTFYAEADKFDDVNEFRENNNFSDRFFVCDDI